MADVRPASGSSPPALPARPMPAVRAQAIAAAQRAFFDQALAASATTRPAAAVAAAAEPTPRATRLSFDPAAPAPERPLRPGSLLDIKV